MNAPTIASTATAVPAHSATQTQVKARMREVLPLPARRMDAAMEMFDHTAVERRFSVDPLEKLGTFRGISDMQARYRTSAIALGRQVASEALAAAQVEPRDIDLLITVSCTGIMIPSLDAHLVNELGFRSDV